ncbi:MAG: FHA domain-containing protein FhaB/FipA [Actinomycetota bacterium]
MSELTLTVIKLGFLAVLWLLILSVTSAMRADLFGVRPEKPAPSGRSAPARGRSARSAPSRVVILDGPQKNRTVPLTGAPVTFGRGHDCTVPLSDEYVSTQHARLMYHDGQWYVEDLGSTNGTYLGSERLTRSVPVGVRSRVRLGKTVFELRK